MPRTWRIACKLYGRRSNVVTLASLNKDDESMACEWHVKKQPGYILWMWPVIASMRDERARRHHAKRMGLA